MKKEGFVFMEGDTTATSGAISYSETENSIIFLSQMLIPEFLLSGLNKNEEVFIYWRFLRMLYSIIFNGKVVCAKIYWKRTMRKDRIFFKESRLEK